MVSLFICLFLFLVQVLLRRSNSVDHMATQPHKLDLPERKASKLIFFLTWLCVCWVTCKTNAWDITKEKWKTNMDQTKHSDWLVLKAFHSIYLSIYLTNCLSINPSVNWLLSNFIERWKSKQNICTDFWFTHPLSLVFFFFFESHACSCILPIIPYCKSQ